MILCKLIANQNLWLYRWSINHNRQIISYSIIQINKQNSIKTSNWSSRTHPILGKVPIWPSTTYRASSLQSLIQMHWPSRTTQCLLVSQMPQEQQPMMVIWTPSPAFPQSAAAWAIWQSNNNVHRQYKITFSICRKCTKGSRFNPTAFRHIILKWCRDIYKRERIKTLIGLFMAWDLQPFTVVSLIEKLLTRWNYWRDVKPTSCR